MLSWQVKNNPKRCEDIISNTKRRLLLALKSITSRTSQDSRLIKNNIGKHDQKNTEQGISGGEARLLGFTTQSLALVVLRVGSFYRFPSLSSGSTSKSSDVSFANRPLKKLWLSTIPAISVLYASQFTEKIQLEAMSWTI
jgi:hypothetical protein